MGELHEIVEPALVDRLLVLLAVIGPCLGALCGALYGARAGNLRRGASTGLLWGLCGTLNWLLWRVYNAWTDHNGLDSVKNLIENLVLFLSVGVVIGVVVGRRTLHSSQENIDPESLSKNST